MCYIYIYYGSLCAPSLSKKPGVGSSALEPLPHWQFAPMISSPGRTLWGKPYDTVCMLSSVLLRLARTSQSSQCFVTPLWAQAAMFWLLSEGHGNLWDYRLKLQVARGIKIYHHKISSYMKCRKTTRWLTRSPDSGKIPTPKPQRDFHSPGQAKAFWCIAWISQIAMFHKKHGLFEIIMLYPYKIFRALFFGENDNGHVILQPSRLSLCLSGITHQTDHPKRWLLGHFQLNNPLSGLAGTDRWHSDCLRK